MRNQIENMIINAYCWKISTQSRNLAYLLIRLEHVNMLSYGYHSDIYQIKSVNLPWYMIIE